MEGARAVKDARRILIISSDKNLREVLKFCFDGWGYEVVISKEELFTEINPIKKISPDVIVIDVHSASHSHLEICRLLKNDFLTAFIPVITLINKRQLRSQLLNIKQGVDDYLIKPPDPLDLRVRVEMAMRRSQYSFYISSLTGLPGGRIIEETLNDKLKNGDVFSFGYMDIDNFKSFNDVYGYAKGDRALMQTAYMLYNTISESGNPTDFIGHIGGDDFVFITTPDRYRQICDNFIKTFDRVMPFHYSPEDRAKGYVVSKDRTNNVKNIPLMSVSIAVVNNGAGHKFGNVIEINEKVAEVKRYLKNIQGSKFMADRRADKAHSHDSAKIYKREIHPDECYRPLGQILLEKHIISKEKLDEALTVHWKRGIRLGEVLSDLGFVKEKELTQALKEVNNG